jgi:DUF4097 and DUF4098 domain-containing protein YvlB
MFRATLLIVTGLALCAPAPAPAQSSSADRARDRALEKEEARRDRDQARQEKADEKARARAERDRASSVDTTVAFSAGGTLAVSCPGGAVIVSGASRNEIRVHARTESGGIRFTSSGSQASLEPSSGRGCSDGRFEVTVPVGTKVVASSWSGSVSVRGVRGVVDIHAQSADVDVRDAGSRVDLESLSGDVTVSGIAGEANIHTISGSITLSGAHGDVSVETVSGDVDLRDVTAKQIRAHTTSGEIGFVGAILDGGRYEFNTHSGEITLGLPANIGAELSVATFNGGIESEFPITLKAGQHGIGAAQAKRLNFTVGHGSARVSAETFSGDINLKRRR